MENERNEVTKDETNGAEGEKITFERNQKTFNGETGEQGSKSFDLVVEEASDTSGEEIPDSDNFIELYEESLKSIREGEVIEGEIVQIGKEYVLVDIGYKSEGQIPIDEFIDPEGNLIAELGKKVEVLLEREADD